LVPALGFFNVYPMRYSFVADHFQYLACIGLIALVVGAAFTAARRAGDKGRVITAAAFVAVLIALGTVTWRYGHVFRNEETLWRDTLAKNDNAWIAYNNLGNILRGRGEYDAALHFFRRAVEINPNHAGALNNIGGILGLQGRALEAIPYFRRALALDPTLARAQLNLGNALLATGRTEEAIACYDEAKRLDPSLAEPIDQILQAYERQRATPAPGK
jgi:tetratricopeptide (TPR) repeat protein